MTCISLAKYDDKVNAVRETRLFQADHCSQWIQDVFNGLAKTLPVYLWSATKSDVYEWAFSKAYRKEYEKLTD